VHTFTYSRLRTGEYLRIEYLPLEDLRLYPRFRLLHEAWMLAGRHECGEGFLQEVVEPGGWVAVMRPNPADIDIIPTDKPRMLSRKAWSNEIVDQCLMIDMVLCRETKEPILQFVRTAGHFDYRQLLLPGKGRIYGLRQPAESASGRIDAGQLTEA
jgi:hypothetical protein